MTDNLLYYERDSSGRTLTTAQKEYFADSKIRDEDGNLLVVYHGTDAEFTVFDSGNEDIRFSIREEAKIEIKKVLHGKLWD